MNDVEYVHRFITALAFTNIIEIALLIGLIRFVLRNRGIEIWQIFFAGLYASFSTIPYVWFVFPGLTNWPYSIAIIFAEAFAFVVEAVFYRWILKLGWREAFLVSFVCNLASYSLGLLLRVYGLWIFW